MLLDKLKKIFWHNALPASDEAVRTSREPFLDDKGYLERMLRERAQNNVMQNFQRNAFDDAPKDMAQDSMLDQDILAPGSGSIGVNPVVMNYFADQRFIGYQACAVLSQNPMISKCCTIPAIDAVRNGWSVDFNTREEVDIDILDYIRELDKKFKLRDQLVEFSKFNKVFGIRVALFEVTPPMGLDEAEYYARPFNIDGVTPGSYKGIAQIDPYWMTPLLSTEGSSDPSSKNFYEPEYWLIQGRKIHRSHLVIARGDAVADILKPTYFYGGISLVQKIYQRVYAAERTANETPMLAQTKRLNIRKTDIGLINTDPEKFYANLEKQAAMRDNYGVLVVDLEEDVQSLDTSLSDVDDVTMTQYQLVAGIANVPITKLLGTQMKGFSSGEHDFDVYYQDIESEQAYIMTPLLDRHYEILMKSYVEPKFGYNENPTVKWEKPYTMSQREIAELQNMKANTDSTLASIGAIDGEAIQARIMSDPQSDYMGAKIVDNSEPADEDLGLNEDDYESDEGLLNDGQANTN